VAIRDEAKARVDELTADNKLLAAERLRQRSAYDLEMLEHVGFCNGIENYSRHLTGRAEGEPPFTLLDYFPDDFLLFVDESHVSLPQVGGMYRGDRARKTTLVDYGFRLPSALDNRPLTFDEFEARGGQRIYVSATPGALELERAGEQVVEQIIRPTGLTDPPIEIRGVGNQVDDLYGEIRGLVERGERVLVTTLTKRMAEELTTYYGELGLRVRYMHADIETLERTRLIYDLRRGVYDVLIGINLLREGLDIPEVSLVAILDADKEGFLRSERSLIQVSGRAARHLEGRVIMYADRVTGSMARAIAETNRRREVQERHNETHGIIPRGIERPVVPWIDDAEDGRRNDRERGGAPGGDARRGEHRRQALLEELASLEALEAEIFKVEKDMKGAAEALDFEQAIRLRERLQDLRALHLSHK
jgi:excinuclease ABC subunit B